MYFVMPLHVTSQSNHTGFNINLPSFNRFIPLTTAVLSVKSYTSRTHNNFDSGRAYRGYTSRPRLPRSSKANYAHGPSTPVSTPRASPRTGSRLPPSNNNNNNNNVKVKVGKMQRRTRRRWRT